MSIYQEEINNIITILNRTENRDVYEWIKNFNQSTGFFCCTHPMMQKVYKIADPDMHSGSSYALLLRKIQSLLS